MTKSEYDSIKSMDKTSLAHYIAYQAFDNIRATNEQFVVIAFDEISKREMWEYACYRYINDMSKGTDENTDQWRDLIDNGQEADNEKES